MKQYHRAHDRLRSRQDTVQTGISLDINPRSHNTQIGEAFARALSHVKHLIDMLHLLASSADVQLAAFPEFVTVADEMALLYADELQVELHRSGFSKLSPEIAANLADINNKLDAMSGEVSLWTDDALRHSKEWMDIRMRARDILQRLGEKEKSPKIDWVQLVKGRNQDTP